MVEETVGEKTAALSIINDCNPYPQKLTTLFQQTTIIADCLGTRTLTRKSVAQLR